MKTYELTPIDGRKSFYGKARVEVSENGTETLISYTTPVVKRHPNGKLERLWDGYTTTTGRHVKAFCGLNKKQYMEL